MGSFRLGEQPALDCKQPVSLIFGHFRKFNTQNGPRGAGQHWGYCTKYLCRGEDLTFPSPGSCK